MQKYWINVAPRERVLKAVEESAMQSQGNEAHLNRIDKDDWVIFYSHRADAAGTVKLQFFTAIGQVVDKNTYQVKDDSTQKSFSRKMNYLKTKETPLIPLIQKLSFIRNKKYWGTVFKMNLIQIPKEDFDLIAQEMKPESP